MFTVGRLSYCLHKGSTSRHLPHGHNTNNLELFLVWYVGEWISMLEYCRLNRCVCPALHVRDIVYSGCR
jgi:hypothetical protein